MSNEHKVERLIAGFFVLMILLLMWGDSKLAKLMILATSALGCVSLLWLRRYLSKDGLIIFAITFLGTIMLVLVNLIFLS